MNEHQLDGTDPIMSFQLLIQVVTEADKRGMSESHAYMALPTYLYGSATSQFNSMQNDIRAVGITCW